jgi:DNA-binding response OmpR family regulator
MFNPIDGMKLLIAEKDQATRRFLADNLTADGADVETAKNCGEALKRSYSLAPDLIIADVNGDTLRLIERAAGEVSIIVLCAHDNDETDRVRKLERGADDVITKLVAYYELRARAGAVMRRLRGGGRRTLAVGALRIDVAAREAWLHERRLDLSATEFALMCNLASDPTRVFTRAS